jgi:hypothetical protein
MKEFRQRLQSIPLELILWIGSIVAILTINPYSDSFSLCPLDNLGLHWCPGCGLGRGMNLLARGEFLASWEMHPLASLGFGVIFHRIWVLIKQLKNRAYYG